MKVLGVYVLLAFVIPILFNPWLLLVIPAGLLIGPGGAWLTKRFGTGKW